MASHVSVDRFQSGDILKGTVTGIEYFGVYVDLGCVEGLVDRLEVSWNRQEQVSSILSIGQEVTVQVLDANVRNGAIRLSLRALFLDPMLEFAREKLGAVVPARVSRVGPIGVMVEFADGLTGLLHPRLQDTGPEDPQHRLQVDDDVHVEVVSVNIQKRQIGVRLQPDVS